MLANPIAADTGSSLGWVVGGLSLGPLAAGLVSPQGGLQVLAVRSALLPAGWGAWQASWVTETILVFGTVAPAGVILLGWTAMVTNEIVVKISLSRQRQE